MKRYIPLLLFICGSVHAQYHMEVVPADTSVIIPEICLPALDDTPAGGTFETGITASTAGLEIKVRADNSAGWAFEYSQAAGTINALAGTVGAFETPDANDAHWAEVASGAGCYFLVLDNAVWNIASAKYIGILIRDVSSPTFADTHIKITQNILNQSGLQTLLDDRIDNRLAAYKTTGVAGVSDIDSHDDGISGLINGQNDLDAAGIRGAVGLAAADLDTQLSTAQSGQDAIRRAIAQNDTTIATMASQVSFTLTAGSADDNQYNGCDITITDQSDATQFAVGDILDYTGSTKTVLLRFDPGIFTMATGDLATISCPGR